MSANFKSQVTKAGLVLSMVAVSFGASAKQMNLKEFMGYTVAQQVQQVQFEVHSEIEQDIYNSAFASLKSDAALPNYYRPAVTISDVRAAEEDEE